MDTPYIIIYVTFPSKKEASVVVEQLLGHKYIACATIVDHVESHYWWQGAIDESDEVLAVMKTTKNNFKNVEVLVKQSHPYEVPEIIAVPIIAGSNEYLKWIEESVVH
ncbi:MAG: divalent-cation tolerance protein CutA [Candidatus Omnitrophica bacterium]|nr:divalent-cation tolerance protein CutA [Candidatus Omnitrophota bacterium]